MSLALIHMHLQKFKLYVTWQKNSLPPRSPKDHRKIFLDKQLFSIAAQFPGLPSSVDYFVKLSLHYWKLKKLFCSRLENIFPFYRNKERLGMCWQAHIYLNFNYKACVRYFLSNFYFLPNDIPSKTMKNVFYFI